MKTKLVEVSTRRKEKTVQEQLIDAGFSIIPTGDDAFVVKSDATGAVLNANANEHDLKVYLTCLRHTAEKHGRDIDVAFKYTRPAHI